MGGCCSQAARGVCPWTALFRDAPTHPPFQTRASKHARTLLAPVHLLSLSLFPSDKYKTRACMCMHTFLGTREIELNAVQCCVRVFTRIHTHTDRAASSQTERRHLIRDAAEPLSAERGREREISSDVG